MEEYQFEYPEDADAPPLQECAEVVEGDSVQQEEAEGSWLGRYLRISQTRDGDRDRDTHAQNKLTFSRTKEKTNTNKKKQETLHSHKNNN